MPFILVNKPKGITSFNVIAQLRKITDEKRIGHAGTLDPLAHGLLICAITRESTRLLDQFLKMDKEYEAELTLGYTTNTYDDEGEKIETQNSPIPSAKEMDTVIKTFLGVQDQMPPIFSAKKINGVPAYKKARQGKKVELQTSKIEIFKIEVLEYSFPLLKIRVHSSSGTYIRSLAHDIGQKLKTGAYLSDLKRTLVGPFQNTNAISIEELTPLNWEKYSVENKQMLEILTNR